MVKLDLNQVVLRRMKEDDIEVVKELIKEGWRGSENRLILYLLTRPLALLLLAVVSSVLRCLLHNFIFALVLPVFLVIVYLKLTLPRSVGILGTSKPYWDYVGSSYKGPKDCTMANPYSGVSCKASEHQDKVKYRHKDKEAEEREKQAGQVWLAIMDEEVVACISVEGGARKDVCRLCRVVVQCWYRREGLGRLLVESIERREKELGCKRVYAHVPFPSKVGEVFFRKLGYRLAGEQNDGVMVEDEELLEGDSEERGWMGFQICRVFMKDL